MFFSRNNDKLICNQGCNSKTTTLWSLRYQKEIFGPGVQLVMVQSKYFEQPYVYGYIWGWLQGVCIGTQVPKKYWDKTVKSGLKEADSFINDVYKAHREKVKWLKTMSKTVGTERFQDGMTYGLEEVASRDKELACRRRFSLKGQRDVQPTWQVYEPR